MGSAGPATALPPMPIETYGCSGTAINGKVWLGGGHDDRLGVGADCKATDNLYLFLHTYYKVLACLSV